MEETYREVVRRWLQRHRDWRVIPPSVFANNGLLTGVAVGYSHRSNHLVFDAFRPVRAWSLAEDISAAEEQEGYGLIGRRRRMSTADYPLRRSLRTLREVSEPKIRGSALWVAHALMSASHVGASDRDANSSLQERQASYLGRAAPAARAWLANQQRQWPADYQRRWWITNPSVDISRYDTHPVVKH